MATIYTCFGDAYLADPEVGWPEVMRPFGETVGLVDTREGDAWQVTDARQVATRAAAHQRFR